MRAALIPPKGYEAKALESDIHLVLPLPPLVKSYSYLHTYKTARDRGDYIILDNGCAEGQLVDGKTLLEFAAKIRAHEIVAPDVLKDASQTLELTRNFLLSNPEASDYNIMAVLQGETTDERNYLLKQYARMDAVTAIGIPKVLVNRYSDDVRAIIAKKIHKNYPGRFQIHLLGLSNNYPNEIHVGHFKESKIRSMDSAQPFKLTEKSIDMNPIHCWALRRRDYFETMRVVDAKLLQRNIETFKTWARNIES